MRGQNEREWTYVWGVAQVHGRELVLHLWTICFRALVGEVKSLCGYRIMCSRLALWRYIMEAVNREMPSRGRVLASAAEWFVLPFLTLLLALVVLASIPTIPSWFQVVLVGVSIFVVILAIQQLRKWWSIKREWPNVISGDMSGVIRICHSPEVLLFVRNPELEWGKYQAKFERLERANQLARAVPGNVQDLGGVSLRQALAYTESALDGFDSDREVTELVEDEVLQLLHARVVRAVIRELASQVGLDLLDRRVLSNFMADHDAHQVLNRIDVHHAADPVGMIRDACATVLTQPNSPVVTHEPM